MSLPRSTNPHNCNVDNTQVDRRGCYLNDYYEFSVISWERNLASVHMHTIATRSFIVYFWLGWPSYIYSDVSNNTATIDSSSLTMSLQRNRNAFTPFILYSNRVLTVSGYLSTTVGRVDYEWMNKCNREKKLFWWKGH